MKPFYSRRRAYVRPKSRHSRHALGFAQFEVLCRYSEEAKFKRFERRADVFLSRRILRETDPQVFYQSPFIPKPHYDPETFLPGRRV
jgi:hypothetical protein